MRLHRSMSKHAGLMLVTLLLVGCTTTTRSVNESPRDPQAQRQTQQQAPSRPPAQSTSRTRQSGAQTLSSAQMDRLVQEEVDQMLQRGVTSSQQVVRFFGQPHSMTRSGDELYWNYTHQFRDERRNVTGMKSLTILFDESGRVQDYDFQDNTFNIN